MSNIDRRDFVASALAFGATAVLAGPTAFASRASWSERRDLYPEGVASGDPEPESIILWTRRPFATGKAHRLVVEIALDSDFTKVIATKRAPVLATSDWTCRVLVGGLKPSTVYWYRFSDATELAAASAARSQRRGSTTMRTVRFAFVSCQSVNEGAQNAYRRMIWEDERAPADERLGFVLHLGDFIYEVVEYPDEVPHRYDRTVFDIGKIPDARKVGNFHVPTTLAGYRMVYQAHIRDPDVQDARAHFPFVCIGDNHEFSWQGWQSFIQYGPKVIEPAQPLRVAANQAWWEYIPSRVAKASGPGLDQFGPPKVVTAPITKLDDHGFGDEANNRTAVGSMTAYRAMRYGKHVDLILTDLHSYKMQEPTARPEANDLDSGDTPFMVPESWMQILDAGRDYAGGKPPAAIMVGDKAVPNFRKDEPPFTVLGREQKAWLKERLTTSKATWKIWGATNGYARHAERSSEFARRAEQEAQEALARHRIWQFRRGRFQWGVDRARRTLRFHPRPADRRLRHRIRRPSQLLGRLRRQGAATPKVRTGRGRFRYRFHLRPRTRRSARARSQGPSAAPALRRRTSGRQV